MVTLDLSEVCVIPLTSPVLKGIERIGFSGPFHGVRHKVTASADSLCGPFAELGDPFISKNSGT